MKPRKVTRKEAYKELKFITRVLKEIYCIASDLGGALICDGDTSPLVGENLGKRLPAGRDTSPSDSKITTISDMLVENRK